MNFLGSESSNIVVVITLFRRVTMSSTLIWSASYQWKRHKCCCNSSLKVKILLIANTSWILFPGDLFHACNHTHWLTSCLKLVNEWVWLYSQMFYTCVLKRVIINIAFAKAVFKLSIVAVEHCPKSVQGSTSRCGTTSLSWNYSLRNRSMVATASQRLS